MLSEAVPAVATVTPRDQSPYLGVSFPRLPRVGIILLG